MMRALTFESGVKSGQINEIEKVENVSLQGFVYNEPEVREKDVRFMFMTEKVNGINHKMIILVTTNFYPEYKYGDYLEINGRLKNPEEIIIDGFNYKKYLLKQKILYISYNPKIILLDQGKGSRLKEFLFSIKKAFLDSIAKAIPHPEVALGGGLVVGAKGELGPELTRDMRRAGVIHMVVLSGFNVTIIAQAVLYLMSFLSPFKRFVFGIIGISLFTILTGATPTVVRSAIMVSIVLYAKLIRRDYDVARSLTLALVFMLLYNPLLLLYDRSFELSFLATVGLIFVTPHIEKVLYFIDISSLRSIVASTIATQIFVTPILLYSADELSLIGIIPNILIVPLIPITMLGVAITGFVGLVSNGLATIVALPTTYILTYEIWVVKIFAHIPFSAVSTPHVSVGFVVFLYVILVLVLYFLNRGENILKGNYFKEFL